MVNRVYLDANIILDFLSSDRSNHQEALLLIGLLTQKEYEIVISEDILTTVYYVAKNKIKVVSFFQSIQTKWEIVSFGNDVITEALHRVSETGCDLEDMLQCLCAKKEGCAIVVTEDKKFVDCGIKVMDYERSLNEIR